MIMRHRSKMILAGMMGNLVEVFDLAICGLLSVYLAKYLVGDPKSALFIVFSTYFAGYLARPIGALFMGLFSDLYGRKIVLASSILIMGVSTALIGFIPPHTSVGVVSVLALLSLRIIQSFACGAEYLNSSAYLVESADNNKKGFLGSWASFGAMAGSLVASITVLIVVYCIEQYKELEWLIWRIPFVFALLASTIGLFVRLCIPESMEYVLHYADNPKPKFKTQIKESFAFITANKLKSTYVFALSILGVSTTIQTYIYAPVQAHLLGHFNYHQIIISNIISLSVMLCFFPIMGKLSDRISRKKIVVTASIGFLILSQPFFYALSHENYFDLLLSQTLISIPAAAYYATVPVMLTEMYPLRLRCTVLSVIYSTAASLAAGLTPLISLYLFNTTGVSVAPTWIIVVLTIFVLLTQYRYFSISRIRSIPRPV